MAWYRTGAKPLAQIILILFKDAYVRYPDSMSQEFRSHVQNRCQYVVWYGRKIIWGNGIGLRNRKNMNYRRINKKKITKVVPAIPPGKSEVLDGSR